MTVCMHVSQKRTQEQSALIKDLRKMLFSLRKKQVRRVSHTEEIIARYTRA